MKSKSGLYSHSSESSFDLLVVGGGHAGVEACWIASQFGIRVGLVTLETVPIASTPCNPSIGGVAKGHVVRELDALGGAMARIADSSGIHYKTLNTSKGQAVRATRVQVDKNLYAENALSLLNSVQNLELVYGRVEHIHVLNESDADNPLRFKVSLADGRELYARKLVLTLGTFAGGKLYRGEDVWKGGRDSSEGTTSLASLTELIQFRPQRFKTGTPARLDIHSLDFSELEKQPSESSADFFHWQNSERDNRLVPQVDCFLTYTNKETHSVIGANKSRSPLFNGSIEGIGARYCPSIEDKVFRYPDKSRHHVFLEPETHDGPSVYPSGISSSLPVDVQDKFIRTIPGLADAKVLQYGYAVEYDVVDTTLLDSTLEYRSVEGLYFAGQVNGTSGYEEAAGQGYVAGVNAALSLFSKPPLVLSRFDSFIGVMIDDLIGNLRDEPYRLFTARAENRLLMREDNAYSRMKSYRAQLGLKCDIDLFLERHSVELKLLCELIEQNEELRRSLRNPHSDPEMVLGDFLKMFHVEHSRFSIKEAAITEKYRLYLARDIEKRSSVRQEDSTPLDLKRILASSNISFECKQRIEKVAPQTLGQLKRISGIRAASLNAVVCGFY